jgi:DNA-binding NarL/FixJ family response regulator
MGKGIRILVVDDHPTIRRGLAATLDPEPDMEVVGAASDKNEAVELWLALRPDITLMDLSLKGEVEGAAAIREIRRNAPDAKVIVYSVLTGDEDVYQALQAGAVTFLTKDTSDEELVETIRDVHSGGRPIPPEIARKLADRLTRSSLTPREVEVLSLVARGYRNKEVADALSISEETVQGHMKHVHAKLGVNDRTRAAIVAAQRGIIRLR